MTIMKFLRSSIDSKMMKKKWNEPSSLKEEFNNSTQYHELISCLNAINKQSKHTYNNIKILVLVQFQLMALMYISYKSYNNWDDYGKICNVI